MLRRLFRKRGGEPSEPPAGPESKGIGSVAIGDVFTVMGLALEYEDLYFVIEKVNRYESLSEVWYDMLGAADDERLRIEYAEEVGQTVTARPEAPPAQLDSPSITRNDLVRMDEERSAHDSIEYQGVKYFYKRSGETFYYEDGEGIGEGFYRWEFISEDGAWALVVVKREEKPFELYTGQVLPPEAVTIYKE